MSSRYFNLNNLDFRRPICVGLNTFEKIKIKKIYWNNLTIYFLSNIIQNEPFIYWFAITLGFTHTENVASESSPQHRRSWSKGLILTGASMRSCVRRIKVGSSSAEDDGAGAQTSLGLAGRVERSDDGGY